MSSSKPETVSTVEAVLRQRIASAPSKMIPWAEVMRLALYEPGIGYYRKGVRHIGRGGDFFTSVSVGPVFGELLAIHCAHVWEAMNRPQDFAVIEQGANDGTLARDILEALKRDYSELFASIQYWIVEPDAAARAMHAEKVGDKMHHVRNLEALHDGPSHAVFICNELLDAFPVHRVCFEEGRWMEQQVCIADTGDFAFANAPITNSALLLETEKLGTHFPSGYTTELNLEMLRWLADVVAAKFNGTLLILDYGLTAHEYHSESRSQGTLRRYHQHCSDDRVLDNLGECDLTAHVNFTRLAQEAQARGFSVLEFIEQGRFLTKLATGKLKNTNGQLKPDWIRQFQTLTHPNHMGMSFEALVLSKGTSRSTNSTPEELAAAHRRLELQPIFTRSSPHHHRHREES